MKHTMIKETHWFAPYTRVSPFNKVWVACGKYVDVNKVDFHNPSCPDCKAEKDMYYQRMEENDPCYEN